MMNPARAFGPQLVDTSFDDFWIWYAGPILSGAIAALLYELVYLRPVEPVPVGVPGTGVDEPGPATTAVPPEPLASDVPAEPVPPEAVPPEPLEPPEPVDRSSEPEDRPPY
jgi:Major intrinsic protein